MASYTVQQFDHWPLPIPEPFLMGNDMANMTIFKDASIIIEIIDGVPPIDQTAEVAALTAQVAALTAKVDLARADAQARKDADAAKVEGQALLDALA